MKRRAHAFRFFMILITAVLIVLGGIRVQAMASSTAGGSQKTYYSVRIESGDTLWSLARTHGGSSDARAIRAYIREIRKMNHIEDDYHLKEGAYLMVYEIEP